jgi:diguanylate cyclase (GGDEF)-like protein
MDPRTVLLFATLMMLLNGGMLWLMHKSLSRDVRPSAMDWRIGTLLAGGGSVLLALQVLLPAAFTVPVANGVLFLGGALYWRAARRFQHQADTRWIFLPVLLGIVGIFWFTAITPSLTMRIIIASAVVTATSLATAWTLLGDRFSLVKEVTAAANDRQSNTAKTVLGWIFIIVGGFMFARAIFILLFPQGGTTSMDMSNVVNIATPIVVTVLPVVGTTAFLLMCLARIQNQWELAAATDYLTNLPNRRTIASFGEARYNLARRSGAGFAVAVIDIDHFKSINDRFGHEVGDIALKHIAEILNKTCRGPNMVGRQGGEEFVAIIDDADETHVKAAVERIRHAVRSAPLALADGGSHQITASIGTSLYIEEDSNFESMLRRADQALYAAKNAGRDRIEIARDVLASHQKANAPLLKEYSPSS